MSLLELIAVAFGLAMDAFAVAVAASVLLGDVSRRQIFRLSWHFGLFQFLMPVLGWLAGQTIAAQISAVDHWLAFALLAFIGGKAIAGTGRKDERAGKSADPTRGLTLVLLSLATSIDALAVGLSFGILRVTIWYPSAIIGLVAAGMTLCGMLLGRRLGPRFGRRSEISGGLVLIAIGVKILIDHILPAG